MNWLPHSVKRLTALAGVVIAIATILFGIDYYRHRYVRRNQDLVRLLPPGDLSLIYADLGLLRRADLLGLFAHLRVAPDKEYDAFIAQTGFDYTRDLDAVAIAIDPAQIFLVGRGRFVWRKLRGFVLSRGGKCESDACQVPASSAGRWVNFISVQSDVLAVAIGPIQTGADNLRPPGHRVQEEIPDAPVWAKLSHALIANPSKLPLLMQIFVISMQSAESVTVSAHRDSIRLTAHFANGPTAETACRQLELQTKMLNNQFRPIEKSDRASIAGLLTAGSFQVVGAEVMGTWPIYPELLRALQ